MKKSILILALAFLVMTAGTVMASVTDEGVTYSASYSSIGTDMWSLTLGIDAVNNTFGASFLNAVAVGPGGTFSNVSLFSSSAGTWGAIQAGPTSSSDNCQDTNASMFCVAAIGNGAPTSSPIQMVFHFTDAGVDLGGPHLMVSWDITGHHFSQTVPTGVPEPASLTLLGAGLLGLGGLVRRRRSTKA